MKAATLARAEELASRTGFILVATADASGMPHLAAAGVLKARPDDRLWVESWFCPGTLANLEGDRKVSLTVWDPVSDEGWQLLGSTEEIVDEAIMDGWSPELASRPAMPQVERRLVVAVERILRFSRAPHTDTEEAE